MLKPAVLDKSEERKNFEWAQDHRLEMKRENTGETVTGKARQILNKKQIHSQAKSEHLCPH